MKHQQPLLSFEDFLRVFPYDQYPIMRKNQNKSFELIAKTAGSATLELPTGSGKTAIGYTFLKALRETLAGWLAAGDTKQFFYIAPTKTIIEQVHKLHPEIRVAFGRNEYPCLYYGEENLQADEIPCSLIDCPHRVSMETGETQDPSVAPCPYYQAKYEAKKGTMVACTAAFYLFTHIFSQDFEVPDGLVIDEAHKLARVVRSSLSYEITDLSLERVVAFLEEIEAEKEAHIVSRFLQKMRDLIKLKPARTAVLLEPWEIRDLLLILGRIDTRELKRKVRAAAKRLDIKERRETLKHLEIIGRNLVRYLHALEYSLETDDRKPLNYTYGFYEKEIDENQKVQYRLVINAYYVAPVIKKMLSPHTLAYSATISDPEIFSFESGISSPFYSLPSEFPAGNTRVFMPADTPNLAQNARNRQDLTKTLRRIAKACHSFSRQGLKSLVVVISNKEKEKFLLLCHEEGVRAGSYSNGVTPRQAISKFKSGDFDVLVGTVANYGEGLDLPQQLAPVIFFLRPGYPKPNDPGTVFEEKRYGSRRWPLWNWRVIVESLQVRGRNIRSADDLGVTIFVSQQFRRFLKPALPEWLKEAYVGDKKWDNIIAETKKMLK